MNTGPGRSIRRSLGSSLDGQDEKMGDSYSLEILSADVVDSEEARKFPHVFGPEPQGTRIDPGSMTSARDASPGDSSHPG